MVPVDAFYKELGRIIWQARNDARMTQAQLAKLVRLSRTSIANIEAGTQRLLLHQFLEMERALGVEHLSLMPASPHRDVLYVSRRPRSRIVGPRSATTISKEPT